MRGSTSTVETKGGRVRRHRNQQQQLQQQQPRQQSSQPHQPYCPRRRNRATTTTTTTTTTIRHSGGHLQILGLFNALIVQSSMGRVQKMLDRSCGQSLHDTIVTIATSTRPSRSWEAVSAGTTWFGTVCGKFGHEYCAVVTLPRKSQRHWTWMGTQSRSTTMSKVMRGSPVLHGRCRPSSTVQRMQICIALRITVLTVVIPPFPNPLGRLAPTEE